MNISRKAILLAGILLACTAQLPGQARQTREEYIDRYLHIAVAHMARYGIPAREIFSELGKRKVIGGQEDQIIDICYQIMDAKKAAAAQK